MTSDEKEGIGLMRYSVIVPLINGSWDSEKSNKAFFRDAAKKTYTLPNGKTRKFWRVPNSRQKSRKSTKNDLSAKLPARKKKPFSSRLLQFISILRNAVVAF